ncbi:hypothetical protein KOI35_17550 [Actinoplanes bogorensis]|uniref:Uncharacterized protein n=1 Tax=Paractinoplanes bogorensis TaxID=1610840 RepID=A0ABS5YRF1_9ACTN|nr:hypothetical protein [Actinoplanes bogorensis]MBU2665313.1 hypothetical protein [Actinoplanes bogorensis]
MWCLDPVNSPELIDRLRPHGRHGDFDVAWVGEGWRALVEACHERLVAVFGEYELLDIRQEDGELSFQAFPRRRVQDQPQWSPEESDELSTITDAFRTLSRTVCEWCGATAELREWRTTELTLCDACDARFPDPPVPVRRRQV